MAMEVAPIYLQFHHHEIQDYRFKDESSLGIKNLSIHSQEFNYKMELNNTSKGLGG
jgi:hypothetical protein